MTETRENYDAAVHGYTFLLLTPFSFVKLLKKLLMSRNCIKRYRVGTRLTIFKVHNPTTNSPLPLHFKIGGSAPHFENCSADPVTSKFLDQNNHQSKYLHRQK